MISKAYANEADFEVSNQKFILFCLESTLTRFTA